MQQFLRVEIDTEQAIGRGVMNGHLRAIRANVAERHVAGGRADDEEQHGETVLLLSQQGTDVRIEAGEQDPPPMGVGKDRLQDGVHVLVPLEVALALVGAVLNRRVIVTKESPTFICIGYFTSILNPTCSLTI